MKSELKKMIRNIIFFLIIITLTYIFIFSKVDIKEITRALKNSNFLFIIIAFIVASNNITLEAINLKRNLKLIGYNVKFKSCLKYSTIGFFFSSITPAATGGQPMQIYAMSKDKIKGSHGASALFTSYIAYMITAIVLAIVGLIVNYDYISEINLLKYLVYIGIAANAFLILIVIIAMFFKKIANKVVSFVIFLIGKFNQEKAEIISKKIEVQLNEYHKSAHFIISHKMATLKTFIISFFQVVSLHAVPYFVFWALGYNNYSFMQLLLLQSVVYISVSALPLPGTVGVSETGFALMYKMLFPTTIVETSMLLSRGLSFYLLVIIAATMIIVISIKNKLKQRK